MAEASANPTVLPDWGRVRQVLIGLSLTFWGYLAVQLSHQPNAADKLWFEDQGLRPSSIYSAMHAPLWLGMGLCLVIFVYAARREQAPHWLTLFVRWQSLPRRIRALILSLSALFLLIFRFTQPITLEDGFNQIYVGDKYGQISLSVQSIEQGCFLCISSGDQTVALEVLSSGDDLGAHLLYAALIRLSGTTPSIEHYISSVKALVLIVLVFISLCLVSMAGQLYGLELAFLL